LKHLIVSALYQPSSNVPPVQEYNLSYVPLNAEFDAFDIIICPGQIGICVLVGVGVKVFVGVMVAVGVGQAVPVGVFVGVFDGVLLGVGDILIL
jgi:hypothetical protein